MSKSLKRVAAALDAAGLTDRIIAMTSETRTAQQAADAVGCALDQIAKSIIYRGGTSGTALLFLTAGGRRVDPAQAAHLAEEPLERADAAFVRATTGFAIGGVAPIGHLGPRRAWIDPHLMAFDRVWAAAGTPRHVFGLSPVDLQHISEAEIQSFSVP